MTRIEDLEMALIFMREGLTRTKNLQREIAAGRKVYPDIPCRIERLEGAIRRIENEVSDYKTDIIAQEKAAEDEKRKAEHAVKRAAKKAAETTKEEEEEFENG